METIKYAIEAAKAKGLRQVKIQAAGSRFSAVISESVAEVDEVEETSVDPIVTRMKVTAPVVGNLRISKNFQVGQKVETGDVIGEIVALGIANDVISKHSGLISEVLAANGDALEYGQVILELERL